MRRAVLPLVLAFLAAGAAASALPELGQHDLAPRSAPRLGESSYLVRRHGDEEDEMPVMVHGGHGAHAHDDAAPVPSSHAQHDEHSHKGPVLQELNETLILLTHAPDPLSYFEYDFVGLQEDDEPRGRPSLLLAHAVFLSVAFFGLLPATIFLKIAKTQLALLTQGLFVITTTLGLVLGVLYKGLTPNLYEGSKHGSLGWITVLLALALSGYDMLSQLTLLSRFYEALLGRTSWAMKQEPTPVHEYVAAPASEEEEEGDEVDRLYVESPVDEEADTLHNANWSAVPGSSTHATSTHGPKRSSSSHSEATLYDEDHHRIESRPPRTRALVWLSAFKTFTERSLVLLGWAAFCTGVPVYTGSCRQNYLNGCMAHVIKGSIFLWYGLLTFARFAGAFAEYGWAWNRVPKNKYHRSWRDNVVSAEFIESFVIFLYGASNTWMERMGKTGAYSIKDIQHISIAIMFWFGGLLGMLLEGKTVRGWLASSAVKASGRTADETTEPASYAFSFNPFPALAIGVTGAAMAAHHQTYAFQVTIHAVWGNFLCAFAVFRFLTYFFLYLRPPASILPSRPPTEALAALCLTAGGVTFIFSTEQVTFAAMRHGFDDGMAFVNITIALVCTWFAWIVTLFALKGWFVSRSNATDIPALAEKGTSK